MKVFFTIIMGIIFFSICDVISIWQCPPGGKPSSPHLPSFPLPPSPPPTSPSPNFNVICFQGRSSSEYKFLPYEDHGNNSYRLQVSEYGIKWIGNEVKFTEGELRWQLGKKYGFGVKEIPYLGPLRNETKVVQVKDPNSTGQAIIFFQARVNCLAMFVTNKTIVDQTEIFVVHTDPLQYSFPTVGNCTPTDQYFPYLPWNPWFINKSTTKRLLRGQVATRGLFWNPAPFYKIQPNETHGALFTYRTRALFELTSAYTSILAELSLRFAALNPSNTTKVKWNSDFITTLPTLTFFDSTFEFDAEMEPNSATMFYNLIGSCGDYAVVTNQIFKRVYGVNGSCIGYHGAAADGIESCDFCGDNLKQCGDKTSFLKAHSGIELILSY